MARAQIGAFNKALAQYRIDVGPYPTTEQGLGVLVSRPASEQKWNGPHLVKDVPPEKWGKPYLDRAPGQHAEYDLYSLGRDGARGGSGDVADITNGK